MKLDDFKRVRSKQHIVWVYVATEETVVTDDLTKIQYSVHNNQVVISGVLGEKKICTIEELIKNYGYPSGAKVTANSIKYNTWFKMKCIANYYVWAYHIPVQQKIVVRAPNRVLQCNADGVPHGVGDFVIAGDKGGKPDKTSISVMNGIVFAYKFNNSGFKDYVCNTYKLAKPCNNGGIGSTSPHTSIRTKRVWYDIILDRIEQYFKTSDNVLSKQNLIAVTGVRRVGKTTLFKQLCCAIEGALYVDCTNNTGLDFEKYIQEKRNEGIRVFFIDEVCKLSDFSLSRLISEIKTDRSAFYLLTGSVPFVVEHIYYSICDGELIEIPPIMFVEYLEWSNSASDMEKLYDYLTKASIANKVYQINYIQGVVEDTLRSYRSERYEEFNNSVHMAFRNLDRDKVIALLHYVTECQFVYRKKPNSNEYNNPDMLIQDAIRSTAFKASDIKLFCEVLKHAGLLRTLTNYNNIQDNELYLFEHPQYLQVYNNVRLDSLIALWLEGLILSRLDYCYVHVGKYRSVDGSKEIDGVYSYDGTTGVVEVKNRKYTDVIKTIKKYEQLCEIGGNTVSSRVITNTDVALTRYSETLVVRNDLLVCALEEAYIDSVRNNMGFVMDSVEVLIDKYFNMRGDIGGI